MTVYKQDVLKRTAILGAVAIVVIIILSVRRNHVYLNYEFNGRVDSIRYGDKGTAIIIVRGKTYVLESEWSYGQKNLINKGDSLVKLKDSLIVTLSRPNGEKIIKRTYLN